MTEKKSELIMKLEKLDYDGSILVRIDDVIAIVKAWEKKNLLTDDDEDFIMTILCRVDLLPKGESHRKDVARKLKTLTRSEE